MTQQFSLLELDLLVRLLDEAADQFGNHSCNDFKLDNTPNNRELLDSLEALVMGEEDAAEWRQTREDNAQYELQPIYSQDWLLMRALAEKAKSILRAAR